MRSEALRSVLASELAAYDRSLSGIRQCLSALESRCSEIIADIAKFDSAADAEPLLSELYDIQGSLSEATSRYSMDIGTKLESLVYELDRLHDPFIREYWYDQFRKGVAWPERLK